MTSSKTERGKRYLVIGLSVVFVILVYARFFHTPEPATPGTPGAAASNAAAPAPGDPKRPKIVPETYGQPRKKHRPPHRMRDLFSNATPFPAAARETPEETLRSNIGGLTLNGTVVGGHHPVAVVNKKFYREGDTIDAFRIVKITATAVHLASDQSGYPEYILEIMKP